VNRCRVVSSRWSRAPNWGTPIGALTRIGVQKLPYQAEGWDQSFSRTTPILVPAPFGTPALGGAMRENCIVASCSRSRQTSGQFPPQATRTLASLATLQSSWGAMAERPMFGAVRKHAHRRESAVRRLTHRATARRTCLSTGRTPAHRGKDRQPRYAGIA